MPVSLSTAFRRLTRRAGPRSSGYSSSETLSCRQSRGRSCRAPSTCPSRRIPQRLWTSSISEDNLHVSNSLSQPLAAIFTKFIEVIIHCKKLPPFHKRFFFIFTKDYVKMLSNSMNIHVLPPNTIRLIPNQIYLNLTFRK